MRTRQTSTPDNLGGLALTLVSALTVGTIMLIVLREMVSVQAAAVAQCAPNCHFGGPAFPAPWADPWLYLTPAVALGTVLLATYAVPKLADLRSHGD